MSFRGYSQTPTLMDKVISAASYMTGGIVGFIWLIIIMVQRRSPNQFLQYHIYQSIFISVIITIASMFLGIVYPIIEVMPLIGSIMQVISAFTIIIIGPAIFLFELYFAIFAFLGKYSYFPGISDNVNQMINRY